jgi:prophage antirepressor-like protein
MASECISLIFEQKSIRIVQPAGEWWVLADVCQAIEIVNAPQAASRLDDDEKGICNIDTLGGTQELLVVSEPGIYKLIATSRKPVAKRFDRWVRHEVLPSIRKTGSYSLTQSTCPSQREIFLDLFGEAIQPIVRRLDRLDERFSCTDEKLNRIGSNVIDLVGKGRKPPSADTIRKFGIVDRHHYSCLCTCLECNILIMDENGFIPGIAEHHHQFNRNDNRPEAMIPLAKECHERIERDAAARTRFGLKAFPMFQEWLKRLPASQLRLPFDK